MWLLLLACADDTGPFALAEGTYYAVAPAGWDGERPLPTVVHYHGANGHPRQYYDDAEVVAAFAEAEVLLLLPEAAEGGHWGTDPGWTEGGRDEYAFAFAVVDDASGRWPVDPLRVYVSGFSVGGALASLLACQLNGTFAAAAPTSGSFWDPLPASCGADPIAVMHTHGEADNTWPIEGRCFWEDASGACEAGQAPLADSLALWRQHLGCVGDPEVIEEDPLTCQIWSDCAAGTALRYCLHDQGHTRLEGWAARQLDWLLDSSR